MTKRIRITVEEFFKGNEQKINNFKAKYCLEGESVDECFSRIATEISGAYCKDEKEKQHYIDLWTQQMLEGIWRPGGGIIASTNNPTKKISVFNCTGFKIAGDTLEDIANTRYHVMKAAASRQGMGIDFSELRPNGSPVNNSAKIALGAINWMRSFDHIAKEVGQLGRVPAMLFSLRIDHPDIQEFISCKDNLDMINNANISIQITDDFMKAVNKNLDWEMSFTTTNKEHIIKHIKARDLLYLIAKHSHATAEPGIQFIDTMKNQSMQESLGYEIVTSNACSEKALPEFGVCCLSSLNMEKVPSPKSKKFKPFIENITKSMVRFMDNVNEYEIINKFKSPLEEQYKIVKNLREIGLGITNLHQWLYDQGLSYDSDEGIKATQKFFKWYFYYSFKASAELAKERGACPAWESIVSSGNKGEKNLCDNSTPFLKRIFKEFPDLFELYVTTGIRNGSLLSIAPTGTLSQTFRDDLLSSGIEPAIGRCHWRKRKISNTGNYYDYYFVIPDTIKKLVLDKIEDLMANNIMGTILPNTLRKDHDEISNFSGGVLDNNGAVGKRLMPIVDRYVGENELKAAHEVDPFQKIKLMKAVQEYVDSSISVTFNLSKDFPVEEVERLYIEAHKAGLKGLSIYRDGCREGILIFEFPKDKQMKLSDSEKIRPNEIIIHHAPKRPKELPCEIFTVLKQKILIGLLKELPYEIFIIDTAIKLPEKGKIIKKSQSKYTLTDENGNVIVDNIIERELINEEIKRLTRMTSLGLRHGTPIDFIREQLEVFSSDEKYPKAIANVLKRKYSRSLLETIPDGEKCGNCGEPLMRHEGCMICPACGMGGHCGA